jgi:hypothetical protein
MERYVSYWRCGAPALSSLVRKWPTSPQAATDQSGEVQHEAAQSEGENRDGRHAVMGWIG